jgi:hypothetical protein
MTTTSELRAKIDAIESKKIILASQRDDVSYSALVDREPGAVKQAAEINAKISELTAEESMLNAALKVASKREAEAKAAQSDAQERDNAEEALDLLESFAKRGAALDAAFNAAIAEYTELSEEFRQLERLGYGPTTYPLVKVTMKTALLTKLMGTDLVVEHLAPHARKTFEGAIEGWSSNVRGKAQARLNRNKSKAATEAAA